MGEETVKVGRRGTVVIPSDLRKEYRIEEGSMLIAEAVAEGILLRPAAVFSVEMYTPERRAEFLLNNAVDAEDYAWAVNEVRKLGLDPDKISHARPGK
ncbi:MAG: AbrB/MazE/SpoVT family DNA-binding domain-containing protein [Peptococcaceae bacterium]|jgi:AbrB family looped-hinge helix DNA binding protein|nr:AbrB/MazE/SpoVT family DNA-binding domain-containing protein [Peptococcaceae bacterium]